MWNEIWQTIVHEFSDVTNVSEVTRISVRLIVALVLGGLLGYEREKRGSSAGLRTHMLVAMGSALFALVPLQAGVSLPDFSRVLQGIIAGVGFLGAGSILKLSSNEQILGLTTAASIWLTAAIGVATGMGRESTALISTILALVVLALVNRDTSKYKKLKK